MHKTMLLIYLLLMSTVILFSQQGRPANRGGTSGAPEGGAAPFATAELSEQSKTISVGGRLQPKDRIVHQTPSAGFIQDIEVGEGQYVREGTTLFSIVKDEQINRYKPVVVDARISGTVSKLDIRENDEVRAGEDAVTIIGTSGYVMNATISDKDAFRIREGQKVIGHSTDIESVTGTLTARSLEPDYELGLFSLTLEFPNIEGLHVGQYLLVDLPIDRTQGIFVNRELLVRRYGKFFIWIIDSENKLESREVQQGQSFGDLIKIEEGISAGERYLTRLTGREQEGSPAFPE